MATVNDIMTKKVVTIGDRETVLDAAIKMSQHNIGCLVVLEDKIPKGLITERDIIKRAVAADREYPSRIRVSEIMSTPLISVSPFESVEKAAEMMNDMGVKRLGVVENNQLVGIVTTTDLIVAETKFIKVLKRYVRILKKEWEER